VLERAKLRGEIRFEEVEFSYDGKRLVLADVSFTAPAGSSVALVGPTGAGKSTLVSLLPRFYDPRSGRVLLDGVDLREFQLPMLRRNIAMVLQPPIVFSATVRENIAYGRSTASEEEVARTWQLPFSRVCRRTRHPGREQGATVSTGSVNASRSRAPSARCRPDTDAPTSALDAETIAALRELMRGRDDRHRARLSTVRYADQIIADGKVAESARSTIYGTRRCLHALYQAQFGAPPPREAAADAPAIAAVREAVDTPGAARSTEETHEHRAIRRLPTLRANVQDASCA
jgi:ABC-type transport system involved in cytochrome bd biosynthesis fused ATPase/permease subunit